MSGLPAKQKLRQLLPLQRQGQVWGTEQAHEKLPPQNVSKTVHLLGVRQGFCDPMDASEAQPHSFRHATLSVQRLRQKFLTIGQPQDPRPDNPPGVRRRAGQPQARVP